MWLGCHGFFNGIDPWFLPHGCWFVPSVKSLFSYVSREWGCFIDLPRGGCVDKPLLKSCSVLESVWYYGKFPEFSQQNMIGSWGTHFDVRHHMHLHSLLQTFQWEFPSRLPKFWCHMWKWEAPKPWIDGIWVCNYCDSDFDKHVNKSVRMGYHLVINLKTSMV